MELNNDNYFSPENNLRYAGSSQIKDFMKCEACALAKLKGEWVEEPSKALMVSSYIDEAISETLSDFMNKHPEIFKKDGSLKSDYIVADNILNGIYDDEMFYKYLSGEHQKILTGEISGVQVKIKIDSYFPNKLIVDLKAIKDLKLIWNDETGCKENFIDYYDYVLQATLYQEIERQNSGNKLPFIIAVTTKEEVPQRELLNIPQDIMDFKLEFLKNYLPHIQQLKEGKIKPEKCGKCNYCKSIKKTTKIYNYDEFFAKGGI